VEQAIHIASHSQDVEITLLWVDSKGHHEHADVELHSTSTQELDDALGNGPAQARAKLEILADRIRSHDLATVIRVESGYPDEVIVNTATEMGAALVIVGTRGLTGFKRFLLGSVAEKVVRMSTGNVLVARGQPRPFSRVLVATDFSPASEHAMQVALALSTPDAQIDILHAWQYPPGVRGASSAKPSEGPLADLRSQIVKRIENLGSLLTQRYSSSGRTLQFTNVFGAAGAVIHDRLESADYDLVAMGTHGHRGFRRFLLGSVAEITVRHAPCAVLVARDLSEQS
jgi:nucleotide-binding universal stress UspA family protein